MFMSHSHFIVFLSLGHIRNWRLRNKISLPKFTQLVNDKIGIRAHLLSLITILSTEKCKMAEFEPKTSDLEGIFLVLLCLTESYKISENFLGDSIQKWE